MTMQEEPVQPYPRPFISCNARFDQNTPRSPPVNFPAFLQSTTSKKNHAHREYFRFASDFKKFRFEMTQVLILLTSIKKQKLTGVCESVDPGTSLVDCHHKNKKIKRNLSAVFFF